MKTRLLFLLMIIPSSLFSQKDTIIYFSKQGDNVQNKETAESYQELKVLKKGKMQLSTFMKSDGIWQRLYTTDISKKNDTSFVMKSDLANLRTFQKVDSGYIIKDYLDSQLQQTGFSKLVFPLIESGIWTSFGPDGSIESIDNYINARRVYYKWWYSSNSFIQDSVYIIDEPAKFIGGDDALLKFIYSNINYPIEAKEANIQGRVIIKFIISPNGDVIAAKALNKAHKSLITESLRLIYLTSGKWLPAKSGNKFVNFFFMAPITFSLN